MPSWLADTPLSELAPSMAGETVTVGQLWCASKPCAPFYLAVPLTHTEVRVRVSLCVCIYV